MQQTLDAEPVAMQNLSDEDQAETEASNRVNSHILELSNTHGVAFEGFEEETLALLMRLTEGKQSLVPRSREKLIPPLKAGA